MRFIEFKRRDKLVAIFIISTIAILLTTFVLMGKFNKWFSDKNYYYTEFNKASDLKAGTTIRFRDNGWEIGSVYKIDINDRNNKIVVHFTVFSKYADKIREDSIAYLSKSGLAFGSTNIDITIGSKRYHSLRDNSPIPSTDSEEGMVMLSDRRLEVGLDMETSFARIAANIENLTSPGGPLIRILHNVESITRQVKDGDGIPKIMELIGDARITMKDSLTKVNNIVSHLNYLIEGNVGKIDKTITDLTTEIVKITKKASPLIDNVDESVKNVGKMLTDVSQIITSMTPTFKALASSLESNMTDSLKDIRGTVQNIRAITTRVHSLMDQIENLPFLGGGDKNRKPLLRDQVERGDY